MPLNPDGIFYADTSTEMSIADITSAMATSIGDKLGGIEQTQTVNSQAERDLLYPTPVQGNSVFRNDLGFIQTYYGAYDVSTNPGGMPTGAGWYNTQKNMGLVPVVPTSITNSSGSASYNSTTGLITFTGVTSLSLNGIFTSTYDHYRYVLEPVTASGASDIRLRFRGSGTDFTGNNYNQYWSMSNFSSGAFQSNNGTNTSGALMNTVGLTGRFVCGSGDIHSPLIARSTSIFYQGFGYNNTNSYLVSSGVNLDTTGTYDGITFLMGTGGITMTGTLKIYGYN